MVDTSNLSRLELVRRLNASVPRNSFGLPEGFYRADLVDPSYLTQEQALPASALHLDSSQTSSQEGLTPPCKTGVLEFADPPPSETLTDALQTNGHSLTDGGLLPVGVPESATVAAPAMLFSRFGHAYVPLEYLEGFPVLPDGRPFWMQLDFEDRSAFEAFTQYIEMGRAGARQIFTISKDFTGDNNNLTLHALTELFSFNCWDTRAKAYDMFFVAAARKQREMRAFSVEGDQYLLSTRILNQLLSFMGYDERTGMFNTEENDFWDMLNARTAVDFLKTTLQIQRVSVGLPAANPPVAGAGSGGSPFGAGASMEVIMRTIAKEAGPQPGMIDVTPGKSDKNADTLTTILQDPDATRLAQELIFKMTFPVSNAA